MSVTTDVLSGARERLPVPATLRDVAAIEYVDRGVPTYAEIGGVEELDGAMWMVCGIFEPARADDPWVVAHARCTSDGPELHDPLLLVPQPLVTRVHDTR